MSEAKKILVIVSPLEAAIRALKTHAESAGEGGHFNEAQQEEAGRLVEELAVVGSKVTAELAALIVKDAVLRTVHAVEEVISDAAHGVGGKIREAFTDGGNRDEEFTFWCNEVKQLALSEGVFTQEGANSFDYAPLRDAFDVGCTPEDAVADLKAGNNLPTS